MVTASAPGKLMLMGEHAVVYGQPCLVTAVDQRLLVSMEETDNSKVVIDAPQVKNTRFVEEALRVGASAWGIKHHGIYIKTDCPFSGKYGFGSSAAVTVAVLRALIALFDKTVDNRAFFEAAYRVIVNIQKVGSGFDVAAALYGGTLNFIKGGRLIEPLDGNAPKIPLVVGYTGIKSDSVSIVNQVGEKEKRYPEKINRIFQSIGKLTEQGKEALLRGDWERLGTLMDFDQEYLRDLGISSQKLEDLIGAAKKAGAWGAKLSGAGGGDCMITLAPQERRDAICSAIKEAGGEIVPVKPHAQGVRIDTTDDQEELFVVVDKDDHVVGYRTRSDCHHDKTLIHRTVGVIVFDDTNKVLLHKRSQTKDLEPGFWGISAAGHVTKGQTYDEAAQRELKEELGVRLPITYQKKFLSHTNAETEMSTLYTARYNGPFHPDKTEVGQIRFVDKDELLRKMLSGEIVLTSWAQQSLKQIGFL